MNLRDRSFLKQFKTFAVRVLSDLKILGFALYALNSTSKSILLVHWRSNFKKIRCVSQENQS
jgi:hypothetical protein